MSVILNGVKTAIRTIRLLGDLLLVGNSKITSSAAKDIEIVPGAGGITQIGDAGSTSHALAANDDLFVAGKIEANGVIYADGGIELAAASTALDNVQFRFGAGSDSHFKWNAQQTVDCIFLGVGNIDNTFLIGQQADSAFDYGHPANSDPTVIIHSANQSTDEWGSLSHDRTDAVKGIGKGGHVTNHTAPVELADDASFSLPNASAGFGFLIVGDAEEYAHFAWDSTGVVDLIANSANVLATDTDTNFCIFDGGTSVTVRNRLGSAKKVVFDYHYTTP